MNKPKRPAQFPARRKPTRPPQSGGSQTPTPRRRSPIDIIPVPPDGNRLKVLGSGVDRQSLNAAAFPVEMVVIQGYTREIEDAFQNSGLRVEDFWGRHPDLFTTARKLDEIYAGVVTRMRGG